LCTTCGTSFAVRNGIPELLPKFDATSTEDVFKQKEMVARDNEATRFESFYEQYHTNLETVAIVGALRNARPALVLDLGCGTGRILRRYIGEIGEAVAADFSVNSLAELGASLPDTTRARCHMVQADLNHLPFRPGVFDACVSSEVLEHLPTPKLRENVIAQILSGLKEDGRIIFTVYNFSLGLRLRALLGIQSNDRAKREGCHASGIFFHNFTAREVRELFGRYFVIDHLTGIDCHFPLVTRVLGRFRATWDRVLSQTFISRVLGSCLMIVARKTP
jgi:SAM-dependent methyltransferase